MILNKVGVIQAATSLLESTLQEHLTDHERQSLRKLGVATAALLLLSHLSLPDGSLKSTEEAPLPDAPPGNQPGES